MTLDVGTRPTAPPVDPSLARAALAQALLEAAQDHVDPDAAREWAVQQARLLLSFGRPEAAPRPLVLDEEHWEVTNKGLVLRITLTQYRLLCALLRADSRTVPTRHLAALMFGSSYNESERVAAHVRRLRRRLVEEDVDGCSVDTVRGVGYRLTWTS